MNFGDLQRNIGKSTVTFQLCDDTGHYLEVEYNIVRRFRKTFRIPAIYRRTTTHGGTTTTRGGERQFKSPFYFPLFIFIFLIYYVFYFFCYFLFLFFCFIFIFIITLFLLFYFNNFFFICSFHVSSNLIWIQILLLSWFSTDNTAPNSPPHYQHHRTNLQLTTTTNPVHFSSSFYTYVLFHFRLARGFSPALPSPPSLAYVCSSPSYTSVLTLSFWLLTALCILSACNKSINLSSLLSVAI